jgi:hypothetical protein
MCFFYICNLLCKFYDCFAFTLKKYNESRKEEEEMQELLNQNPYYALE